MQKLQLGLGSINYSQSVIVRQGDVVIATDELPFRTIRLMTDVSYYLGENAQWVMLQIIKSESEAWLSYILTAQSWVT